MTHVLADSHAKMTQNNDWGVHLDDRLSEKSDPYTLEEARALDSRPRRRHQTKPRVKSEDSLLTWVLFWGLFSVPGLFWIVGNRWGMISGILAGLALCWVGYYWGRLCPLKNYLIKYGPGVVGVMLIANSVVSLILPATLLLVVSLILAPFGLWRFYAEEI